MEYGELKLQDIIESLKYTEDKNFTVVVYGRAHQDKDQEFYFDSQAKANTFEMLCTLEGYETLNGDSHHIDHG